MSETDLDVHIEWSEEDCAGIQYELSEGRWKSKNLVGSESKTVLRTPCIRVINYWKEHRGLLPFRAVFALAKGPIAIGWEVSHKCVSVNGSPISQCINVHHMKLERKKTNIGRNSGQWALIEYWKSNRMKGGLEGPLFLEDIGWEVRTTRDSSFLNCKLINKVDGIKWYPPISSLLSRGL